MLVPLIAESKRAADNQGQIAQAFKSFFDKTVDMLMVIGDELQPFQKHKSLFTNQDRLRQALYDAYLEIIDFCTDAKNAFLKAKRRGV